MVSRFRCSGFSAHRASFRAALGLVLLLLFTAFTALPAYAGIVLLQHASKDAGVTSSSSLAFPSNNTAGNWIGVVIRAGHSGQTLTVSDTRGNIYKQALQSNETLDTPNGETFAIYYAENIVAGANTVAVAESLTSNTLRFAILEYSGVATANSLDVTVAGQASGTTLTSGTATTTVGGDLILGEVTSADGETFTAGSGYTIEERVPAAPNTKLVVEDAVQLIAGTVSVSATVSISNNGGAMLAAFRAASGTLPPSITSLTPPSGPVGTPVTIAGTNFGASQGTSTVTFNGVAATPTSWSATSIVVPVPTGATTGNVVVTVGGVASNGVGFTVMPPAPSITFLTPTSSRVGYGITINGANFGATQGSSTVTFNGTPAAPITWGPSSILVGVPNVSSAGPATVVVTVGGVASNGVNMTITPGVSSLNPSSGRVGTLVTITGTEFGATQGASTVTIGGITATPTSWSDTSIIVSVPSGVAAGLTGLSVTVGGIPSVSNGVNFTVTPGISSLSPASGLVGTPVTITGTSFGAVQSSSIVSFNGTAATPASWSDISITVPVPSGATSGNVAVTVGGNASNGAAFTVIPPPTITSLSPSSGPVGMWLLINGTNFGTTVGTVTFNGVLATSGVGWSSTSIQVAVPVGATTGNIVVTAGGIPSNGFLFTVTPAPVITSVSPTSGAYGTAVTVTGTGFGITQGSGTVSFNGTVITPTTWLLSTITFKIPTGATSGNVVVTVGSQPSNGAAFTVLPISVSLAPTTANVIANTGLALAATVQNDVQTQGVTFSLAGAGCSGATCGTLASQSSPYTIGYIAPSSVPNPPTVTVTATSIVDPAKSATCTITLAPAAPSITSINPTSGTFNTLVTISGASFGSSQGLSTVTFNGLGATTVTSWSSTTIIAAVPSGATTGNVVVTVGGTASNALPFTVVAPTPNIASLSPSSGQVGTLVTISGTGFSSIQGGSSVTFNGIGTNPTSWSNTSIVAPVPSFATSGNVVVTIGSVASNAVNFSVMPNIASISPFVGGVGTPVTITGTGFGAAQGTSTVGFNGTLATPTSWSVTSIVAPLPPGATSGNVVVTVGSVASNGVNFSVTPNIVSIGPLSGAVGTPVTITGTGFGTAQGTSSVSFNGTLATPTSWSTTSIVAPVPAGTVSGNVVVTVGGISSNPVSFNVFPVITSLTPSSGPVGTSFTINGSNFGATKGFSSITFNGIPVVGTSWSDTSIVTSVPNGATTGNVMVTVGTSASNGVSFTVTPSPNITNLSPSLGLTGTVVTISGSNFGASQGTGRVLFNGTPATPTSWSATSIVAPVPTGASTGLVYVVLSGGAVSNGATFTVGPPPPSITSVTPTSGTVGASVTITGLNFGATQTASTVSFNGVLATPTTWGPSTIVTPVPFGADSGSVVVTVGGAPSNSMPFTVVPNISNVIPVSGAIGTPVGISGNAFGPLQGTSTVTFNGTPATPTNWSDTSITAPVPAGATTGSVFVTVGGNVSNGVGFTVTPITIASLSPASGPVGTFVTITGTNFGATQGASTVAFNGTPALPTSWGPTSIVAQVPSGATTGNVVVTVGGILSNVMNFTVTTIAANIALVQHVSKDAGVVTSSSSLAFPSNNTGGNWIGVVIRTGHSGQTLTVSDTHGNIYKQALQSNETLDTPNGETFAIYYAENIVAGANTVTVAESITNNTLRFAILEYSGVATSNSFDVMVATQGTGTAPNSGNATTTAGGDLVLGMVVTANGATMTAGSGFTIEERVPAAPNTKLIAEDEIKTVVGAAAANATLAASDNWGAGFAAFKAAAGGVVGPNIANLNPASGPVGTAVTIIGTNFGASQGTSTVTFNGTPATPTSWTATSIGVPVPAGTTSGNVVVTVGGMASNGMAFTVTSSAPSIASLNPASGPVGTSVTITGTNFGAPQGASTVAFNGAAATPASWSATTIVAPVPAGSTSGNVIVTVGGVASNGVSFSVTSTAPSISSLSPTSGLVGTSVTIAGTNFGASQGASTVTFNGTTASPTSWGATSIVAPVPAGSTTGNVVVTVGGVASNGVSFSVTSTAPSISSLSPTSGPVGTSVTITGTNFGASQGSSTVSFSGTTATPASWGATTIGVPVPSSATSGNVVVTVGGVASNGANFTVTVPSANGITLVQHTSKDAGITSSSSLAFFSNNTSGNFIAVVIRGGKAFQVFTVSDSRGNTYHQAIQSNLTVDGESTAIYYAESISGGANTVTVADSIPNNTLRFAILEYSGVAPSNSLDVTASSQGTDTSPSSGNATTTGVGELLIAEITNANGTTFGAGSGFSLEESVPAAPGSKLLVEDGIQALPGVVSGTASMGALDNWGAALAAFQPASAGAGPHIVSVSPRTAPVGSQITIAGTNFGSTQGASTVTFNGTPAIPKTWSSTSIVVPVPAGATSGNVTVTVGGTTSNGSNFTVGFAPPIAFVQASSNQNVDAPLPTSQNFITVPFKGAQTTGNMNVVVVGWRNSTATVASVTDTVGNVYTLAAGTVVSGTASLAIYYAADILPSPPNTNVVSVAFNGLATTGDVRIAEYSGLDPTNPLDVAVAGQGSNNISGSNSISTTNANDLLIGANEVTTNSTAAGSGYTSRGISINGGILEDQIVSATGSYSATATLSGASSWIMQMVAFKAPAAAAPGLALSVSPSVANIPTGYGAQTFTAMLQNDVQRLGVIWSLSGGGCSAITCGSLSSITATSVSYTAPANLPSPATVLLRATSVADATKAASATITVTQGTLNVAISPKRAAVTLTQVQQFNATVANDPANAGVVWSVDGNNGGSATIGTVSSAGLFTPGTQAGVHTVAATSVSNASVNVSAPVAVTDLTGVFSYHYDSQSTGQNTKEYALTTSTVNPSTFGLLFNCPVDGFMFASPLYAANLTIGAQTRNVVFVATEHNSVYAFDADSPSCVQLWKTNFLSSGVTTVAPADTGDGVSLVVEFGISGTPVIDPATNTLYVAANTKETVGTGCSPTLPCYFYRLHALDLITGAEKFGGPVLVAAPNFNPLAHLQRPALLLNNGTVYIAFGSHADLNTYQGWVMGYNASTLAQNFAWPSTVPTGGNNQGAIWGSGNPPVVDASGNVYVVTGNGQWDGTQNYSDSVVKLSSAGSVLDYFTPFDQTTLNVNDIDLGSSGAMILPDSVASAAHPHVMIVTGKIGVIYLLDQTNLGKFHSGSNQDLQEVVLGFNLTSADNGFYGQPAYWNGNLYAVIVADFLRQFPISNAAIASTASSVATKLYPYRGATPSVSANGSTNGIVWIEDANPYLFNGPSILDAYDASHVATQLYSSPTNGTGAACSASKFIVPVVANGKVYVSGSNCFSVFGLLPN